MRYVVQTNIIRLVASAPFKEVQSWVDNFQCYVFKFIISMQLSGFSTLSVENRLAIRVSHFSLAFIDIFFLFYIT